MLVMDSGWGKKILRACLVTILLFLGLHWIITVTVTQLAIHQGAYITAELGMLESTLPHYVNVEKYELIYAGPNSFDGSQPHVWYVIVRIWAEETIDGCPVGFHGKDYETPGHYYIHTKRGWVQISEVLYPTYLGFWIKAFSLAGPGSPVPTVDYKNY